MASRPDEKRIADLEELLEIARALTAERDIDKLLEQIMNAATRMLEADRSSLYLYDPGAGEIYTTIAQGPNVGQIRLKLGEGMAGWAAANRKTLNVPDAYADPRFAPAFDKRSGFVTRSALTVPMLTRQGELIGVLQTFNKRAAEAFDSYDEGLAMAIASHAAVVIRGAQLTEHYVRHERQDEALRIARSIQAALLPRQLPRRPGYDVAARFEPCDETAGDFYDFIDLGADEVGAVVADVTGHGVGPAIVAAGVRSFLRALGPDAVALRALLLRLNELAVQDLSEGRFVTLFLGTLGPEGRFRYVSAGQGPVIHLPAAADEPVELDSTDPPLGVMQALEADAATPELVLSPGDIVVIATDGLVESRRSDGEFFGQERLRGILRAVRGRSAAEIADALVEAEVEFRGASEQSDDLTILVVKGVGPSARARDVP
jgi:sigma-B regulation protein RsbU (phosphoserine phosphatase)